MNHRVLKKLSLQLVLLLAAIAFTTPAQAQAWLKDLPQNKVKNHTLTLKDYQSAFIKHWNTVSLKEKEARVKHEIRDESYEKFKRWEWYWETRVNPKTGAFPNETAYEVYKKYLQTHPRTKDTQANPWTSDGPTTTTGGYAGLGRINCVAFSPADTNTLYVGSASGGVWKTTNLGSNWTPVGDFNNALGVSGLVVENTGGQDIIYLATGDKDHYDTYSVGVLKSTDGGATWNTTGLSWQTNEYKLIYKLLPAPNNNSKLYAATNNGLYMTTNGASSWTRISTLSFRNIVFQPGSSSWMIGSTYSGKIYYSTNAGYTWTQSLSVTGGGRTELAVSANNNNIVYAIMSNASNNGLQGFYTSSNAGISFTKAALPNTLNLLGWNCDGSDTATGQGWYDLAIAADPNNASKVFVGGINTWTSSNGGSTWTLSNFWHGNNTCGKTIIAHADKHELVYQQATHALFECNDGGIYKSSDGNHWTNIGSGLVTSQIYRIGVSSQVSGEVLTGLQDNGTKLLYPTNWHDVYGGDGLDCLIDFSNDGTQYGELPNGSLFRTKNYWNSTSNISDTTGLPSKGAWLTPFIMNPKDHNTLYAGYTDVYKTNNQGDKWTKISDFKSTSTLRSMAISPSDTMFIYAATLSKIYQSRDGGNTWTDITGSLPTSSASITNITVNDSTPGEVWVTLGGYNTYGVYETRNNGVTWDNISSGLPAIPIDCIVQNRLQDTTQLYAGTDVGVFVRQGNSNWVPFKDQLPNVVVTDLEIQYTTSAGKLYAGTFGRGLWSADLYTGHITQSPAADFRANNTIPTVTDTVSFRDMSNFSPTSWQWTIQPSTVTYLSNTNSHSENPQVRFDSPGSYTITLQATGTAGSYSKTITSYIDAQDTYRVTVTANRDSVCSGDTTQLFATASGGAGSYNYSWTSYPAGFTSSVQNPIVTPVNDTTTYTVAVLDGDNNTTSGSVVVYRVTCTGISNNEALTGKVNIYPNPTDGRFTVVAEKDIEKVEVLNENGAVVFSGNYDSMKATLNTRLPQGLYFVKVTLKGSGETHLISLMKLVIR